MSESTWSPAPPADTYNAIQRAVAGYVLMPDDDEALDTAAQGIRRAIDRLNMRTWNWALLYDDIVFVAGQADYTLDQEFKSARNFEINDASGLSKGRLMFQPWKQFLLENSVSSLSGDPCYYSASNVNAFGLITLDVAPTAAFVAATPTGRLWYYRRIQYPSSAGTSLDVPSEAVAYLQAAAEGYTADRYAPAKAPPAYMRAEKMLHELVVDDCHGGQTDWE